MIVPRSKSIVMVSEKWNKGQGEAIAYVGVVQYGCKNPVESHESKDDVHLSPPWHHQRAIDP